MAETPTDKIADAAERENKKSNGPKAYRKQTCKGKFRNADAANFRQNAQQQAVLLVECPKKNLSTLSRMARFWAQTIAKKVVLW